MNVDHYGGPRAIPSHSLYLRYGSRRRSESSRGTRAFCFLVSSSFARKKKSRGPTFPRADVSADAAAFAEACSGTQFILNHAGFPLRGEFDAWREGMAALAARPNAAVKMGDWCYSAVPTCNAPPGTNDNPDR